MGRVEWVDSPFPEGSGYTEGIYYSKWPADPIPEDPCLDFATFALDHPYMDKVALVDAPTGETWTFRELKHRVYAVASGLADVGVKQGDVVMILSHNGLHFPTLVQAISLIGGVVTAVNPASLSSDIAKQAKDSGTKFIISAPEFVGNVATLKLPVILIDVHHPVESNDSEQMKGVSPVGYLSELYKGDSNRAPKVSIRQSDPAMLLYSSGTTGLSKGVVLSHGNVIAAAVSANDPNDGPNKDWTYLAAIPFYHAFGMIIFCVVGIRKFSRVVIMPRFEFPKFLAAIQRHRVTHLTVVPPIVVALLKSPLVDEYDLSSVRVVASGGAPVGAIVMEGIVQRFEGIAVGEGYGMTETCAMGAYAPAFANKKVPYGSVGYMLAHMQAKIVDVESGKSLPPNQRGELWLRGPCVMKGYLNNEKATAETLDKDGWLHTGDIAQFDSNGIVFIVDRLKELIKYNGLQVAPAELEAILLSHPQIEDTAVAGFPNEWTGEIPVAFVVRRSNSLTAEDVMGFVAKQVAPYKKVRKVIFVESIPKSPAGKILRRELKAAPTSKI